MKKVRDIMNPFPIMVEEDTSLLDVFKIVREKHLSHLLIVSGHKLVGIISKEDLLNKMLDLASDTTGKNYNHIILRTTPVSRIMTSEVYTAGPEDILSNTIDRILETGIHCIPVVNKENEPIGILNPMDILKAFSAGVENVI